MIKKLLFIVTLCSLAVFIVPNVSQGAVLGVWVSSVIAEATSGVDVLQTLFKPNADPRIHTPSFKRTKIETRAITIEDEIVRIKQEGNIVEAVIPWKGEKGLTVKYDLGTPTLAERFTDKAKEEALIEKSTFFDSEALKFDIILYQRPSTNSFCYDFEGWEDYNFYYQPPLTQEEIKMGAIRSEEIVGSYAIYHKTLKWHAEGKINYETGKFGHIPFPYVWEIGNEKNKIRADDLTFNEGRLCVIAPQSFLDNATYPVRIDPTFGKTTVGGSSLPGTAGHIYADVENAPEDGEVTSISAYHTISIAGRQQKGVLTLNSTLNIVTNGVGGATDASAIGWATSTMATAASITNGTTYLIGIVTDKQMAFAYDAGSSGDSKRDTTNSYTTPENWGTADTRSELYSVYATYTASGGGGIEDDPKIYSASNQTFTIGQTSTNAAMITLKASTTPGITIADDIRISIASGFNMEWDTSITSPTFGGSASGKVDATVSYPSATVMLIAVTTNFSADDTLTISGLKLQNFSAPPKSGTGAFLLYTAGAVSGAPSATSSDMVTIRLASASGQPFRTIINKPPNYLSINSGLVGHWTFDGKDMIGGVKDVSGQGNHGTLVLGASGNTSTTTAPGKLGQASVFDGVDDQVSVSNTISDVRTISFWMKPNTTSQNILDLNGTQTITSSSGTLNANNFSGATIYVNGVVSSSIGTGWNFVVITSDAVSASAITLGKVSSNFFGGILDDVRVYSRVVLAQEISTLYNAGSVKFNSGNIGRGGSPAPGLVGHWTFDGKDMIGGVKDISGQGNHGTLILGDSGNTSTTTAPGKLGQALVFDGTDDYITTILTTNESNGMSFSFWVKNNISGTDSRRFISKGAGASLGRYYLEYQFGNRLYFFKDGATDLSVRTSSTFGVLPVGKWIHIVMTWDGSDTAANVNFYRDTVLISKDIQTDGVSLESGSALTVNIGAFNGASQFVNGAMDDVRIYNRALSADEVKQLYQVGTVKLRP